MCWIWLVKKKDLFPTLENQRARGLDWIWIIDIKKKELYRTYKGSYLWCYESYIKEKFNPDINENAMHFIHHRAASVWEVSLWNTHPFVGKKFLLAQNWTSKDLYKTYWDAYWKETDTETLLCLLEDMCDTLDECIDYLDTLECTLWIIFIFKDDEVLIYADSCRWSYVDIYDVKYKKKPNKSFLRSFTNLKENSNLEYKNGFFMVVCTKTFEVKREWNYDGESYNTNIWWTQFNSWWVTDKKTRVTKSEKTGPGFFTKKETKKKTKAQQCLWTGGMNLPMKNSLLRSVTDASNEYTVMDMLSWEDISDLIGEYWLGHNINDITRLTLGRTLYQFVKSLAIYQPVYTMVDTQIFNTKKQIRDRKSKSLHIDFLFLVPINYLLPMIIWNVKETSLNLTRHARFLTTLDVEEDLLYYYYWLHYLVSMISPSGFWMKIKKVFRDKLTLESFLWLIYDEEPRPEQITPYNITSLSATYTVVVEWFVRAWYALWLTATEMNITERVYSELTSKYLTKDV